MASQRSSVPHTPNRWAASVARARRAGRAILDLTSSNPTRVGLAYPEAELLDALDDAQALVYRPEPCGARPAREAVAGALATRGVHLPWQNVVLTASTSEGYSYLLKLLCDAGDQVLVPRPSYPLLEHLARLDHVELAHYSLRYDGEWRVDVDSVERALGPRTRAIVVVSPNHPTGSVLSREERARLVDLGLPLIADEVFAGYPLGERPARLPSALDAVGAPVFGLDGLSKLAGLPGLKLGWIAVGGPQAWTEQMLASLELIADTYLSVGSAVQLALPRLLELGEGIRRAIGQRCRDNLAALRQVCATSPVSVLHVQAGWSAVLRLPRLLSEEEWALGLLHEDGVLVQPGWLYDFEQEPYVVVSLLTPPDELRAGVGRLVQRARRIAEG